MPDQNLPSVHALYDRRVAKGQIEFDQAQRKLASYYDKLLVQLSNRDSSRQDGLLSTKRGALGWLFGRNVPETKPRGLYVHGQVGRGKTMLMDWFYEITPVKSKRRAHFHAFMQDVHVRIHAHRQAYKRGETREEDPVLPVAKALAQQCKLLCFDEFHVLDIADAMILSRLFTVMFEEGVVLVATSNVRPDDLYPDGLNRSLFLPFIGLLKANCDVWNLDARTDFRRQKLMGFTACQSPLGPQADAAMDEAFALAVAHQTVAPLTLTVRGHTVYVPKASETVARFTFDDLCAKPLGAADYIELAKRYSTIFIDHVPALDYAKRNEAKRFIILIDVLYDNGTRLFLSTANLPDEIYQVPAGLKAGEFARTSSRLVEMTGAQWLAKWEHRTGSAL
jgi:cell division protein ZapE